MALFATNPPSLIPSQQQSAGTAKTQAANLTQNLRAVQGAAAQKLFQSTGTALQNVQQQIDAIMRVMRGAIPQPTSYSVTDPSGNLIAWIGYDIVNNVVYEGGWFEQLYAGGTDPTTAFLIAAANSLTIKNATVIIIGPTGTVQIQNGTIDVINNAHPLQKTEITNDGVEITNQAGSGVGFFQRNEPNALLNLLGSGATKQILLDSGTAKITATDSVSTGSITIDGSNGVVTITDSGGSIVMSGTTGNIIGTGSLLFTTGSVSAINFNGTGAVSGASASFSGTCAANVGSFGSVSVATDVDAGTSVTAGTNFAVGAANGLTGSVTLLKLTGGGFNGFLTFTGGIITAFSAPT